MVVETIDFYAEEDAELPMPMTQRDIILLNAAEPYEEEQVAAGKGDAATQDGGAVR